MTPVTPLIITRTIGTPIRKNLTWEETWKGEDEGLIYCWEKGIEMSFESPEIAARAVRGELVVLNWRGGVQSRIKEKTKDGKENKNILLGTFHYLATWQGLRGEDLRIHTGESLTLVCTKFNRKVKFETPTSTPKKKRKPSRKKKPVQKDLF